MDILALVAAFGGGAFGALIGALPAFILTGAICIAGAGIALAGGADVLVGNIAFGAFLGPHVAFAGGAAAAAYAANMRSTNKVKATTTGEEISAVQVPDGSDICLSLNVTGDYTVLIVGGIFGILGYLINYLYSGVLTLPTDTVGMTVFTSGVIVRLLLGKSGLTGKFTGKGKRKYFSTGKELVYNIVMGAVLGIVVSFVAASLKDAGVPTGVLSSFPVLCFGISAFSLIFTQTGSAVPGTHHITLIGALAAVNSANPLMGILFAIISALLGDFAANTFNSHNDSHIDPPAFAIFICTFIILAIF